MARAKARRNDELGVERNLFRELHLRGSLPLHGIVLSVAGRQGLLRRHVAFHVDSGEIDGTAVEDRSVVLLVHIPQAQATDGNWKLGLYVDERASGEQAEKLGAVFGGQLGGPVAALAPLVGEVAGVERAPISFVDDGLNHRVTVGNAIDTGVEDLTPPGSSEPTGTEHRAPGGPIGDGGACDELAGQRLRHRVRGRQARPRRSPGMASTRSLVTSALAKSSRPTQTAAFHAKQHSGGASDDAYTRLHARRKVEDWAEGRAWGAG